MNVQDYIENIPQKRKSRFESIRMLVKSMYPRAEESMHYKMPTYRHDEGWVALANRINYISLYTCSADHLVVFKKNNPEIPTGKGCINFRDKDEIPLADLRLVVQRAMEFKHR